MPASLLCDFENGNNNTFNLNQFDNNNDHRALDLEFNWLNIGANTTNNNNLANDLSNLHHANNARSMFSTSNNMASSLTIGANTLLNALEFNDNFKITKRSQNTTECVPVPSSEHVAEIVGRQGCKIKALRAKTNTYIKTPVRGEEPVFVVTGRKEDVNAAKREILSAAEHFSQIRAQRKNNPGNMGPAPNAHLPGHITVQVRVPYRVVGLVVGPKGATIKRIQQQTNTYIITPSRDKDPVFEVTGLPDDVETARKEIEAHIAIRTGGIIDSTTGSTGGTPEESISDFSNSPLLSSFDNLFLSTTGLGNNNMKPADLFGAGFASNINNVSTTAFVDQTKKPMANSTMLSASSRVDTFCSKSQAYKDLCSIFQIKQDNNNTITNSSVCNSGKNTSTGSYDTDEGIGDSPTFDILASGNFNTMWSSESIGNIAAAGNGVNNGTIPAIDRNNYFMDNFNTVHGSPSSISNNVDFNHRSLSLDSTQSSSSSSSVSCVSTSAPASTSII